MSIAVNIYYTGTDGNAGKFVEEMEARMLVIRWKMKTGICGGELK